jgi:hypothetical protein
MPIESPSDLSSQQKKANVRTGLILASIALMFLAGFFVKMAMLGK